MKSDLKNFQALYEEYFNALCGVAFRIIRERVTAREIVQDAFVDLWQKGNWQELKSVKAYLHVAVYNRAIAAYHRQKRFTSEGSIPELTVDQGSPMEQVELETRIHDGIQRLPDQCRTIFLLSREAELTYNQIAEHLGLSVKTVERQMGIALKKMRECLAQYETGKKK